MPTALNTMTRPRLVSREASFSKGWLDERWRVGDEDVLVRCHEGRASVYLPGEEGRERQEEAAEAAGIAYEFSPIIDDEVIVIASNEVEAFLRELYR